MPAKKAKKKSSKKKVAIIAKPVMKPMKGKHVCEFC